MKQCSEDKKRLKLTSLRLLLSRWTDFSTCFEVLGAGRPLVPSSIACRSSEAQKTWKNRKRQRFSLQKVDVPGRAIPSRTESGFLSRHLRISCSTLSSLSGLIIHKHDFLVCWNVEISSSSCNHSARWRNPGTIKQRVLRWVKIAG